MSLQENIAEICNAAVSDHTFPGCVVGYISDGKTSVIPIGHLTYENDALAVTAETVYDVASITKSIPTSSIALKLIEDGRLSLDDKVAQYIPELKNQYRDDILVRHLLTYTAVFNPGSALSDIAKASPDRIMSTIFEAPLRKAPGKDYLYLDAPAILLGLVVERICKQPLDQIAKDIFFGPLGMVHTSFALPASQLPLAAPSEIDWRGELRGIPHDEKAWALAAQGIVAGHAGMFSTAGDLLIFAQMLLNDGRLNGRTYFTPPTVELMHTNQTTSVGEAESFGWQMNRSRWMGHSTSIQSYGRTGYPGTSILMDPLTKTALVHLSNHTYPKRPSERAVAINAFRANLANLVFADRQASA